MALYPLKKDRSLTVNLSTGFEKSQVTVEKSWNGFKDPEWKLKVGKRVDATTPFIGVFESLSYNRPFPEYLMKAPSGRQTAPITPYSGLGPSASVFNDSVPDSFKAAARNLAVARLNSWVTENRTPINAQVMALEALKTLSTLTNPFKALRELQNVQAYDNYRKHVKDLNSRKRAIQDMYNRRRAAQGRPPKDALAVNTGYSPYHGLDPRKIPGLKKDEVNILNEALNRVAAAWTELRFGLMPIAYDIHDIMTGVSENLSKTLRSHFSAYPQPSVVLSSDWSLVNSGWVWGISPNLSMAGDIYRRTVIKVNYHISYGINYAALRPTTIEQSVQSNLQSLADFVPSLWEDVPYSWAADYFFGIGEWLESIANTVSVKPSFNCHTWVTEHQVVYESRPRNVQLSSSNPSSPWTAKPLDFPQVVRTRKRVLRDVGQSTVSEVSFRVPHKPTQLLNLLAVAKKNLFNF